LALEEWEGLGEFAEGCAVLRGVDHDHGGHEHARPLLGGGVPQLVRLVSVPPLRQRAPGWVAGVGLVEAEAVLPAVRLCEDLQPCRWRAAYVVLAVEGFD